MLEAIPGPRFVLPREVQQRIIEASRADLEEICESFGLKIVPEPVEPESGPGLDAATAREMALKIVAAADRLVSAGGERDGA